MAKKTNNGANLGFENKLREMADKMRGHMDSGEYKHVVLGLIFLKYISDAFQGKYDALAATLESDYKCERVAWHPDRIDHDGDCVTIHSLDAAINGTIEDGVFCVVGVEWYGEGSGTGMMDVLGPALADSTGELEAVCVWDGGEEINRLIVKDGDVRWEDIDL